MILPKMRPVFLTSFRAITRAVSPKKQNCRTIYNTPILRIVTEDQQKSVALFDIAKQGNKEKSTFLDVIRAYESRHHKTGHVNFVYAAMRYMDEFAVNEDLEVYKAVLNTMPKGRFVSRSLLQAEFLHYPREQQCIIDFLEKMENNGVVPDPEIELMILNIFGEHGFPLRKLRRMAYWMLKFKNLNPWPFPRPMPTDALEIALLAIKKIASVDVQTEVTVFNTEDVKDSIEKTWIVSASSPDQERLIRQHPKTVPIYVEGPDRVWVSKYCVDYFILRADPKQHKTDDEDPDDVSNLEISYWKKTRQALDFARSIHEQDDAIVLGCCATGTSSKDSLLSWIRCLQMKNPDLENIPILFRLKSRVNDQGQIETAKEEDEEELLEGDSKKAES